MDNLELLKKIDGNSINLTYCDILYGTGRKFKDYQDLKPDRKVIEDFYTPRIKEMHRTLKDTGSIYLQMDWRINHWIRCIMDEVFGYNNFRNAIIWNYPTMGNSNHFPNAYDIIFVYSKSDNYVFNIEYQKSKVKYERYKPYLFEEDGKLYIYRGRNLKDSPYKFLMRDRHFVESNNLENLFKKEEYKESKVTNVWSDIPSLKANSKEFIKYNTQKPLSLMERIIKASSNQGDLVADFFMGSGAFLVSAKELNRNYIGCDINPKAIEITNTRLNNAS